jgi:hypothetical protein
MKPFPDERSVLILDNCRIHHNEALVDLVISAGKYPSYLHAHFSTKPYSGCLIMYLPAYSPDLNPIEESFSTREYRAFRLSVYMLTIYSQILPQAPWPRSSSRSRSHSCTARSMRLYYGGYV